MATTMTDRDIHRTLEELEQLVQELKTAMDGRRLRGDPRSDSTPAHAESVSSIPDWP